MKMKMTSLNAKPDNDVINGMQVETYLQIGKWAGLPSRLFYGNGNYYGIKPGEVTPYASPVLEGVTVTITAVTGTLDERIAYIKQRLNELIAALDEAHAQHVFPWLAAGLLLALCALVAAQVVR